MTDAERQQQIAEHEQLLTRYFANVQDTYRLMADALSLTLKEMRTQQTTWWLAGRFSDQAQAVVPWVERLYQVEWSVSVLQQTAEMAARQLAELRQLAHGVTPGEVVLEHNPWTGEAW